MSQIKKIFLALVILVLIFPAGAGAQSFGFSKSGSGFSFSTGGGSGAGGVGLPSGSIYGIIENVVFWLLGIFAFFGIIGFVVSGIMYLVSAGNDEMITKAKKYMMYSIVGVIVGLMGYVILQAAYWMLGGSNPTF